MILGQMLISAATCSPRRVAARRHFGRRDKSALMRENSPPQPTHVSSSALRFIASLIIVAVAKEAFSPANQLQNKFQHVTPRPQKLYHVGLVAN